MAHISETELDTRVLASALRRKAWLLLTLAALVFAATYAGLGYVEPLYAVDTSVLIEERESALTRAREESGATTTNFDESAIQSHVEVLRSRGIAEAVIDKLELTRRPEFDPATRPSLLRSLLVMLGLKQHPADETVRQRVMETYYERLSVFALSKSRVIGIRVLAPDPQLAAEVANAIADTFVELQQDAKRESTVAATLWLEQEIERLRLRVAEAEQAVAEYRASNELFDVNQSGTLSSQQLGDLNAELARARAARSEAEARAELVQSLLTQGGALEASQEVLDSQLIQRLRERQVALRAQIAELSTTLLPGHPRIRSMQGQLANLEGQIRLEAERIRTALNTAARVAAAREQSLLRSLDDAKVEVGRSNEQEIDLRALEREAAAQRELLESFLGRYREAVARTDADYIPADARIISRAVPSTEPYYPKKMMMAVAASLAALLLGSAIVVLREFTSGRAFRLVQYGPAASLRPIEPDAVFLAPAPAAKAELDLISDTAFEESVKPEVDGPEGARLGATEVVEIEPAAIASGGALIDPDYAGDEALAAAVLATTDEERPGTAEIANIIVSPAVRLALFAGASGGEGAGDVAFAAARSAARENLRIVIIDVGSTPSPALGAEEPGLSDLLAGDYSFGEVIRREESSRVHLIPMGARGREAPLQRLRLVTGALTHTYDKVVVVADSLAEWPHEHISPDLAAIVCGPDTTEALRTEVYEAALERGARSALIVRFTGDSDDFAPTHDESVAA